MSASKESFGGYKKNTDDKIVSVIISVYAPLLAHIKICKFIFTSSLKIYLLRIMINQSYHFSKAVSR